MEQEQGSGHVYCVEAMEKWSMSIKFADREVDKNSRGQRDPGG